MPTYTQLVPREQVFLDGAPFLGGENPVYADAVPSIADYFGWEPVYIDDAVEARSAVVHAYMYHEWGAVEAFNALVAHGLFGDVETFMATYSAGVEALASRMPLPPTDIPSPAPSVRCAPSDELLEAVSARRTA